MLCFHIQEMWDHCAANAWSIHAMFDHVYRLSDTLASTKECIEDLFGAGSDLRRTNKNPWKCSTVERLHHLASYWTRLKESSWPKLKICMGDFTSTRRERCKRYVNIGTYAPMSNTLQVVRLSGIEKRQGRDPVLSWVCFPLLYVSMFFVSSVVWCMWSHAASYVILGVRVRGRV